MSLKRLRDLNSQARQVIVGVYKYMAKEAEEGIVNPNQVQLRTSTATNTSIATLRRILREVKTSTLNPVFRTPAGFSKRRGKKRVTGISEIDKCLIRRHIHKFYIEKKWPSVNKLLPILRSDINFKGGETSLNRVIKGLGFVWKKTTIKKTSLLIEDYQIRLERINFLEKIEEYRAENRPIVYSDELYIQASSTNPKANEMERLVIMHAGSEAGFVPNAFASKSCSRDSHNSIFDYREWLQTQLIPNLPPKSVLVLDNATYHNKEYDPAPQVHSKKCDMEAWLTDKGIPFTSEMLKPQLYELIELNKGKYQNYSVDQILWQHGHDVLRLPPNQQDLNPMELAWVEIKRYVASKKVGANAERVVNLTKEKFELMEVNEWKALCDKVRVFEEDYRQSDLLMDRLSEDLIDREDGESDTNYLDVTSSDDDIPLARQSEIFLEEVHE